MSDTQKESIEFWEKMARDWADNPQWRMSAPNYGEIVAEIVRNKSRFQETPPPPNVV